jgi:hypothetical protein
MIAAIYLQSSESFIGMQGYGWGYEKGSAQAITWHPWIMRCLKVLDRYQIWRSSPNPVKRLLHSSWIIICVTIIFMNHFRVHIRQATAPSLHSWECKTISYAHRRWQMCHSSVAWSFSSLVSRLSSFGIEGTVHAWFRSYLSDWKQSVGIENVTF